MAAKKIRERGERREKSKTLTKLRDFIYKMKICAKKDLLLTKLEGAYIGHQMYGNTTKPNNLAKIRDKGVIHQI